MSEGGTERPEFPLRRPARLPLRAAPEPAAAGEVGNASDPPGAEGAMQTAVAFARALLSRDARGALEYFGRSARLLTADGTEVSGDEAIGGVLGQLATAGQRLEISPGRTLVAGEVALCEQSWRLVSAVPGLASYERATRAMLVLGRGDSHWLILIAAPWR